VFQHVSCELFMIYAPLIMVNGTPHDIILEDLRGTKNLKTIGKKSNSYMNLNEKSKKHLFMSIAKYETVKFDFKTLDLPGHIRMKKLD
jgi:hypothetical protein